MRSTFRPEFLNRIDDTIVFGSLTRDDLLEIVDLQVERLNRILAGRHLQVSLTEAARRFVADAGYDPAFGARRLTEKGAGGSAQRTATVCRSSALATAPPSRRIPSSITSGVQ